MTSMTSFIARRQVDVLYASGEWRRGAHVFAMLIGIYGSKDMFVSEYRHLLAARLLSARHIDVCAIV